MDDLTIRTGAPGGGGSHAERTSDLHSIDHLIPASPHRDLKAVVVVPVRDEAQALPDLIDSFARQREIGGDAIAPGRLELILLFSDCVDGSPDVAAATAVRFPTLPLSCVDLGRTGAGIGVGRARRLLMDAAARRIDRVRPSGRGVILTTDADTLVAPDWVARNQAAIAAGADAVGGQVLMKPRDRLALPAPLRRRYLMDHAYRRLVSHLSGLVDPEEDDPLPRHHQHAGASLAVTAEAYRRAGGMPPLACGEDEAFFRALKRAGARFHHDVNVRTFTSGRLDGRVEQGLAGTLRRWRAVDEALMVEAPKAVLERLKLKARLRALHAMPRIDRREVIAVAARIGTAPEQLETLLLSGEPFECVYEATVDHAPTPERLVDLEAAVLGMRRLVAAYASLRSRRSRRHVA